MPTNSPEMSEPDLIAAKGPAPEMVTGDCKMIEGSDARPDQACGSGTGTVPLWKQLYQAAILEMDTENIMRRILDAEQAIVARALALHRESSGNHAQELGALAYSANFLAELRRLENTPIAGPKSLGQAL
jgi:hypothetical protein